MTTRSETSTIKIKTAYGSHYAHVSHVAGRVVDVRVSSPGKFMDTDIGKMLEDLGDAIGAEIRSINRIWK